jgi:hypothetical protein
VAVKNLAGFGQGKGQKGHHGHGQALKLEVVPEILMLEVVAEAEEGQREQDNHIIDQIVPSEVGPGLVEVTMDEVVGDNAREQPIN